MSFDRHYTAKDGGQSAPAFSFKDVATGWYRTGASTLCAVVGGVLCATIKAAGIRPVVKVATVIGLPASITLTAARAGETIIAVLDGAYTLPLTTAVAGKKFTFLTGTVSGGTGVVITANAADRINAKTDSAGGTAITAATAITNTGATDVVWDRMELVSDGVSRWQAVDQSGVWA